MTSVEAAKYLPEGQAHIIRRLTDEELAIYVDAMFFKESKASYDDARSEAEYILFKKEVAYQVIQRLTAGKGVQGIIATEADWKRYFQLKS